MSPKARSHNLRSGPRGEQLAADFLAARGCQIAARNLRTVYGEIDLLVRRRSHWTAVEVKTRKDHPAPERMVDDDRLDRMERAMVALSKSLRPRPRRLTLAVIAIKLCDPLPPTVMHFSAVREIPIWRHSDGHRESRNEISNHRYFWPIIGQLRVCFCKPTKGLLQSLIRLLAPFRSRRRHQ